MVQKKIHTQRSGCPVACALDIVGDHWTLLIIRDLMFLGLHEYKEMLAGSEGISSNILTDRLKKLAQNGLIASVAHPEDRKRKLYFLTGKGKALVDTIDQPIDPTESVYSARRACFRLLMGYGIFCATFILVVITSCAPQLVAASMARNRVQRRFEKASI